MWSPVVGYSYSITPQSVRHAPPPRQEPPLWEEATVVNNSEKRLRVPCVKAEVAASIHDVLAQISQASKWQYVQPDEIASLNESLNAALLNAPCSGPKQYQLRILQLHTLLNELPSSDDWKGLRCDLAKHLLNTHEEAEGYYERFFLQGFWPLHAGILALPDSTPDLFGNAIGNLREFLQGEKSSAGWVVQVRQLLPRLLPPARFRLPNDQKVVEGLIQSCAVLMLTVKAIPGGVKAALGAIQKSYRSLLDDSGRMHDSYQLSGPGLHSLRLKAEIVEQLFQPDNDDAGYMRTHDGLCYCLEAHRKGVMPSEQDWARLVLGQLLGYHKDAFTFVRVSRDVPEGSYVLRVGYDNASRNVSAEEESLRFVISLLAGDSEDADEEFLNRPVPAEIENRLRIDSIEEFVLDVLALLEQHSQSYDRWMRREVLGKDDLYVEEGCALPLPVYVTGYFARAMHDRLRCLMDHLTAGATHGQLAKAMDLLAVPEQDKQSITQVTMDFLETLNLEEFSIAGRVSLVGKVLTSFPGLSSGLALPGHASEPSTRAEFFCEAVKQGHVLLVSRFLDEEKKIRLEPGRRSLLRQLFENNQTALLTAAKELDVEMVQLLLRYGVNVEETIAACFGCMVNFSKAPLRAAVIISCLLHHIPGIYLNKRKGMGRWTLIHHLAYLSEQMSEVVEPLVIQLVRHGASLNIVNKDGETALDVALREKNRRICRRLVGLGAVCAPHPFESSPLEFSAILSDDDVAILKGRDLALRWRLDMAAFGKDLTEEVMIVDDKYAGSLVGPHIDSTPLPKWVLNDSNLFKRKHNNIGSIFNSKLDSLHFSDCRELLDPLFSVMSHGAFEPHFFDANEELGCRFAVQSFFDLLVVQGVAHSELVQVSCTAGSPLTVLMVQKIKGDKLLEVLEREGAWGAFDPSSFSHLILTSLLLDFEEIKPDSFVLESLPDGSSRLVCIDPRTAFFHSNHNREDRSPIRNVLFCLDQMTEKVHPAARQWFLTINPARLLRTWFERLEKQDNKCSQVFENKKNGMVGQVRFASGFITNLYNKIRRLQALLTELSDPTHLEVLVLLNPVFGKHYTRAFNVMTDPIDRFASLWCSDEKIKYFDAVSRQNGLKRSSSCAVRRLVDLSSARKELGAVICEESTAPKQFEIMRNSLQDGDLDAIEAFALLKLDSSKQAVIAGFDFSCLNDLGFYTRQQMLKVIFQGYYYSMSFRKLANLELSEIQILFSNSPYLQTLTLEAVKFLPEVLNEIFQAKYLRCLMLIRLNDLCKVNVSNCAIGDLRIKGCCNLEELRVPLSVKRLYLHDCSELDAVWVGGTNEGQHQPENFLAELSIQNCPKLQPWERLFFPWYEKEKAASLYLTHVPVRPITKTLWHVIQAIARAPKSRTILNALKGSQENALGKYIGILDRYLHSSVEELELPATCITDDDLEVLGGWFPQLRSLRIMGSRESSGVVSDAGLAAFIKNSSRLTSLEIAFCPGLLCIEDIVKRLPGLLSLTIKHCPLKDTALLHIAQHRHNIRRLAFVGCKDISDEGLIALAQQCKQLESIDFRGCVKITDDGLGALLRSNPTLSSIDVSGCAKLQESLYRSIRDHKLRFSHVNLSGFCTSEAVTLTLEALAEHCEELRSLSLSHCSYEVSSLENCLNACRNLVYLDLSHGSHLGKANFANISDQVRQLEILNLAFCMISDQGFDHLLKGCRNLKILDLSSCRGITKNGLQAIVKRVPQLEILKFQSASIRRNIQCEDLQALQQSMPHLKVEGVPPKKIL